LPTAGCAKSAEIITGISQQAALAIQNEPIAARDGQRERLEREMQLAREIQRAFVPQSLPEPPGWELQFAGAWPVNRRRFL